MQQTVPAAESETTAEEAVLQAMMSLGRRMRQRRPDDEIEFPALHVLKTLSTTGPLRLGDLAAILELDASTVSRHARHLEDLGFLVRTTDPDDRRASRVAMSEGGAGCLDRSGRARLAMIGEALDGWSQEDRDLLRTLMSRLHRHLSASAPNHQETL